MFNQVNRDIYTLARLNAVSIADIAYVLNLSKQQLIKKLSKKTSTNFRYNIVYVIFHLSLFLDDASADFFTDIYCGELKLVKKDYNKYNVVDDCGVIVGCISSKQAKERGVI